MMMGIAGLLLVAMSPLFVVSSSMAVNVLLIVADDLGYNDLTSYGSPTIETPHIDSIGALGVKFTQFYVGSSICTPSRAAMLTGRLPIRSGIYSALDPPADEAFRVFYPSSVGCLPDSEITIAEALKPVYSTAIIGKWHLGHNQQKKCLPGDGNKGFDFFYGLPYSHEEGYPGPIPEGLVFPPVPLMTDGFDFIEQPFNQSDLTSRYTSLMVSLIEKYAIGQNMQNSAAVPFKTTKESSMFQNLDFSKPFFIHLGYENPHVPLFLSDDYVGKSRRGLYGDSVQEMDLSIGRVLQALDSNGLRDNTLVIFTSDNGAWVTPSNGLNPNRKVAGMGPYDGGCNAPFFEGKGSTWEGGMRVPLLMSLPKMIPSNRIIRSPVTAMDFFPTILEYAGISIPTNIVLDGKSIRSILDSTANVDEDVHECIYIWREKDLYAIRCGGYKAHFITRSGFDFSDHGVVQNPPLLFNVEWDPAERLPLNTTDYKNAAILKQLVGKADIHLKTITRGHSQYLAQNWTLVPCCLRGSQIIDPAKLQIGVSGPGPWEDCWCKRIEE